MLTRIKLENFKCFRELDLKCAPLTLLTGINGTGKSSVFQALVLLRQTVLRRAWEDRRLFSMGPQIDLGPASGFLHGDASHVRFVLEIDFYREDQLNNTGDEKSPLRQALELINSTSTFDQTFHFSRSDNQLVNEEGVEIDDFLDIEDENREITMAKYPPFGGELVYVNAERTGPRVTYPLSAFQDREESFGNNAELAWSYLNHHQWSLFDGDDPRLQGHEPQRLLDVVNMWLKEISPGTVVNLEDMPSTDRLVASFSFENTNEAPPLQHRPTNVGFGLSYTLPVIVSLLMPKETLCLIENPEAHLHPRGQTKIAELAARAAKSGVQVMVETHSDHFIDGIRIAVREGILTPDDVAIHYFERQGNESVVRSPVIDSNGRLSEWPAGFFDQHEMNLVRLLRPIQGS